MHTLYYILALLYATLLYADFSLVWLHTPYKAPYVLYGPYALKGQKLLAQGIALGINGPKPVAL